MKQLITAFILMLSFNTFAANTLLCNDGNSIESKSYNANYPTINKTSMIYPSDESLFPNSDYPTKTECVKTASLDIPEMNIYAVIQTGHLDGGAGKISYMFNLTEGWGVVGRGDEQQKDWWVDKLTESWFISCSVDSMTDLPSCTRVAQGVAIIDIAGKAPQVRLGFDTPNAKQACYRVESERMVCRKAGKPFYNNDANFINRSLNNDELLQIRTIDDNGNEETIAFDPRGGDVSKYISIAVIARLMGIL